MNNNKWYLIYTKPKSEAIAKQHLEDQGFTSYLPLFEKLKYIKAKNRLIISPLFPRYLFIQLNLGKDNISVIRSTPGVSKLISFSLYPTALPDGFVEELMHAVSLERGKGFQRDNELFKAGDKIEIMQGPFAGQISRIHSVASQERVYILLNVLGSLNKVELSYDDVKIC